MKSNGPRSTEEFERKRAGSPIEMPVSGSGSLSIGRPVKAALRELFLWVMGGAFAGAALLLLLQYFFPISPRIDNNASQLEVQIALLTARLAEEQKGRLDDKTEFDTAQQNRDKKIRELEGSLRSLRTSDEEVRRLRDQVRGLEANLSIERARNRVMKKAGESICRRQFTDGCDAFGVQAPSRAEE